MSPIRKSSSGGRKTKRKGGNERTKLAADFQPSLSLPVCSLLFQFKEERSLLYSPSHQHLNITSLRLEPSSPTTRLPSFTGSFPFPSSSLRRSLPLPRAQTDLPSHFVCSQPTGITAFLLLLSTCTPLSTPTTSPPSPSSPLRCTTSPSPSLPPPQEEPPLALLLQLTPRLSFSLDQLMA